MIGNGGVEHHPREVVGTRCGIGRDGVRSEAFGAPGTELAERHGGGGSARDVHHAGCGCACRCIELGEQEGRDVSGVQAIAHLMAQPVKADVAQRTAGGP